MEAIGRMMVQEHKDTEVKQCEEEGKVVIGIGKENEC
jgi:nitrate reductase NapAB chaperone NapD